MFGIRFTIKSDPVSGFTPDGNPAFTLKLSGGNLTLECFYDSNEKPLVLTAPAAPGDTAELIVRPYRLELYIGGVLLEEEWPWGNPRFDADSLCGALGGIFFDPPEKGEEPCVIGRFENPETWKPGPGIFIGDCMPYCEDGRYHVIYLKDRHHHQSKWGLGAHQWGHISTSDFRMWEIHPAAVEIDDPMEASICTGSRMRAGDTHYLYYTVRMSDRSPAHIARSVSSDGYHFSKDRSFGFTLSERWHAVSARDPKIVPADDGWHMFITTSDLQSGRGALAHLFSADGNRWEELDAIYTSEDENQPECPDYFFFKGHYYLVFSLLGRAHYRISDKPFTDFRVPEGDPAIPCHNVPKAAVWQNRLIFTGFNGHGLWGGDMSFLEADADRDGTLLFMTGKTVC